ncbi:hypothetical protein BGAL_0168g00090 [Botrytis galanthina]|uniref:DUF7587 domain-containing protein n=1 Tax=Botrytis galanthina TaxID=278940 RepID=A0A4S8QXB5_9HELO|nr:hypothetical protein BGAL_0168g00090 [Botrytis galanthina]
MDEYVCSRWDLPNELYRVHYVGSRTSFSSQQGFAASDITKNFHYNESNEFKQAIKKQFTWSCREPPAFISLFSDKQHAENWGLKKPWCGHQSPDEDWTLYVINTVELLKTTQVFRLHDLVEKLSLDIPDVAKQHIQGAILCLHHIPTSAIVASRTPSEIKRDRELEQLGIEGELDYLGDYGDADSDREMLQENYNTIFEKNIEDNW